MLANVSPWSIPVSESFPQSPSAHTPGGYSRRPWRVFRSDETLVCPNDHRFDDPLVWGAQGGLRCNHRNDAGNVDCGSTVLVMGGGMRDLQGRPVTLLVEVSPSELQHMKRARMDVDAMLAFLHVPHVRRPGGGHAFPASVNSPASSVQGATR